MSGKVVFVQSGHLVCMITSKVAALTGGLVDEFFLLGLISATRSDFYPDLHLTAFQIPKITEAAKWHLFRFQC
jgi:hypothetical protein